ncbi:MAG: acyl-CoA thioesterase [Candidatus Cloacimonetes bacterium]|jgi:thioesterase III|nr:acyl-CoA thioesterase [Candidatus Cloacimonadota bacterium]MBT6993350.1 acyl-CoA thioesterase [Candidatus Cloacimonadota bacterium]MBT7470225.1 acyl-CoA thioesterase [Candidatus Cloacimonadota bacterium]
MKYERRIFGFECDIYGHLNNANYLKLYEEARADALEQIDLPIRKLREMGIAIYLTKIELDFKKGVELEEKILVKSEIITANRLKSIWQQEIYNNKNELCNVAIVQAVFIKKGKPFRISKELNEHFQSFIG